MADGSIPTDALVSEVYEHLSDDSIRPLTDQLKVITPTEYPFDLQFTYYINSTDIDKAVTIQAEVAKAVETYRKWQTSTIGRDINPSVLTQMVVAAGAKRIEIASPEFTVVPTGSVARVRNQFVTYGGVEHD